MTIVKQHTRRTKSGKVTQIRSHSRKSSEKLKRLLFIKKNSPKRFEEALRKGDLVPTAKEMNVLSGLAEIKYPQDETYFLKYPEWKITGKLKSTGETIRIGSRNDGFVPRKLWVDESGKKYLKQFKKWWKFPEQVEY